MILGIIKDKDGSMVSHRSLLKVLFNPFLRCIGITIATNYDKPNNKLLNPVIVFHKPNFHTFKDAWIYEMREGDTVVKKRMFI